MELFEGQGNPLHWRSDGTFDCGHPPFHPSKSGRCVHVDPRAGLWYCSSCRTGGGPVAYVMALLDCSYRDAAAWLAERYGPPPGQRRPPRRVLSAEVP